MDWIGFLTSLVSAGVRMAIPLAFAGIGVIIIEKSGVLNIGCESQMLIGAFMSFAIIFQTENVLLGILAGGLIGGSFALVIAYLSVSRKQNQSVVGIIMNIFTAGLTSFLYRGLYGGSTKIVAIDTIKAIEIPLLSKLPIIGGIFNQTVFFYILIVVAVVAWYILYQLKIGLILRAVGENPRAAQASGVNVIRYRYVALIIGGFLSGIGGAFLIVGIMGKFTESISAGRGFIGLAIAILSRWNPIYSIFTSFIFGTSSALQLRLQAYGFGIPYQLMLMIPFIVTLLSLVLFTRGAKAPKSLGEVFNREGR